MLMGENKSEFFSEKGLAQGMEIGRFLPPQGKATKDDGAVAQLVRAPPCHGGGCGFDSRPLRHSLIKERILLGCAFFYVLN